VKTLPYTYCFKNKIEQILPGFQKQRNRYSQASKKEQILLENIKEQILPSFPKKKQMFALLPGFQKHIRL
jgi:hypothetical protein